MWKELHPGYWQWAGCALRFLRPNSVSALPNPRMQPTGRGGPALHSGVTRREARQWKRRFVWAPA